MTTIGRIWVTAEAVRGRDGLAAHDRGGVDVLRCTLEQFRQRLVAGNHTLKRALCDPSSFSGIGNAYSDEILHAARLSPLQLTRNLEPDEIETLFDETRGTLKLWIDRLREQAGSHFPDKVTAFRPGMAVHGKYRQACPTCESSYNRIWCLKD